MLQSRKQFLKSTCLLIGAGALLKHKAFSNYYLPSCPEGFCNYDLASVNNPPFSSVTIVANKSYGNGTSPGDVKYNNENNGCINPSGITECLTDDAELKYDVFYPAGYDFETCPALPAVIYAHGGGYSDCSNRTTGGAVNYCREFAKRGFVTFNIGYRQGIKIDNLVPTGRSSVQQELGLYRAFQDVRGAIRSIIKDNSNMNNAYKFNPNTIFLAGSSAGSVAMLSAVFFPNQMAHINPIFPYSGSSTIENALGPINADYYYGESTINYLNKIKGVCNMWGSITLPEDVYTNNTEMSFFADVTLRPVISFHGESDGTINYLFDDVITPPATGHSAFVTEKNCLLTPSFKTQPNSTLRTYGSKALFDRVLTPFNVFRELYLDSDADHGINMPNSNYGILVPVGSPPLSGSNVMTYIVARTATFFQAILSGTATYLNNHVNTAPFIHNVFEDSCNKRKKCEQFNTDGMSGDDCYFTF